jgi:hypothetical protein
MEPVLAFLILTYPVDGQRLEDGMMMDAAVCQRASAGISRRIAGRSGRPPTVELHDGRKVAVIAARCEPVTACHEPPQPLELLARAEPQS